jgi:hypothetical protein
MEQLTIHCENHRKHLNTMCAQNAQFLNVTAHGICIIRLCFTALLTSTAQRYISPLVQQHGRPPLLNPHNKHYISADRVPADAHLLVFMPVLGTNNVQHCGKNTKPCNPWVNYQIWNSLQITNNVVHMCLILASQWPPCSEEGEMVSIYIYIQMQQPLRYSEIGNLS